MLRRLYPFSLIQYQNYQWSAFATGELVEAQKKFIEDPIDERYRESYDEEW